MYWIERIRNVKILLVVVAIVIAIASLLASNYLIRDLQREEANNMEVWAEAMRSLNNADETTDLNLVLKVINGNNTIPVIVLDREGSVLSSRNIVGLDHLSEADSLARLDAMAHEMKRQGNTLRIDVPSYEDDASTPDYLEIVFDDSLMLRRLAYYPYIQLGVVVVFVMIALFALFMSMKAEQNKVWVGLSKETAHQLGTPISSLMAWTEVLRETYPDDQLIPEMNKDVKRLERVAERFSKIGSVPEPRLEDLCDVVCRVADYMDHRTSSKVVIATHLPDEPVVVMLVASLFEWVIENLCKNAVDAMDGSGRIDISVEQLQDVVVVRVKDTGKGIRKQNFNSVFKPGYTTKMRGWGLGLSLAHRIVSEYHKGSICVESSELGRGTTFRIEIPSSSSR